MSELGFRYRPSVQADLAAHGHAIRLLTEDLADVPVSLLEQAAQRWALSKPYLPKACDLIELAREIGLAAANGANVGSPQLQAYCNMMNASNGPLYFFVAGEPPNRRVDWKMRGA